MVVIIASEEDTSVGMVQYWLHSLTVDTVILHTEYFDSLEQNKITRVLAAVRNNEISGVWYRTNYFKKIVSVVPADIRNYLRTEFLNSVPHIINNSTDKILGSPDLYSGFSKIEVLKIARECGLKTPDHLVTNSKQDIIEFKQAYRNIIVKPFSELFVISKDNRNYKTLTYALTDKDIEILPDYFGITWVQERVPNAFDLRVCYLAGKFYAALIVKQAPAHVDIVDYRDYVSSNTVLTKYNLPKNLASSIRSLMDALQYNFGVLDFVITPDNQYFFLEANKYGVFNDISKLYGFSIEYEIAKWLTN